MLLVKDGGVLMPFVFPDGKCIGPTLEQTSFSGVCRDWEDKADSDVWRIGRETIFNCGVDWLKFMQRVPL